MELAVRYGEDNAVEDRRLLSLTTAPGTPRAMKEIVITPQSAPPLRAGTYFVSVGVFATGIIANCTLTAEVELDEEDQTTDKRRPAHARTACRLPPGAG